MNAHADALGGNDSQYMHMVIAPEYLEAFGIEIAGKNLVKAELVAKSIRNDSVAVEKIKSPQSRTMSCRCAFIFDQLCA
jgi:hypothetical protein